MHLEKKKVHIKLYSKIINKLGEVETSNESYKADYYHKAKTTVWMFKELQKDVGVINHRITLRDHKVTIKRTGIVQMQQQFIIGQKTECLYQHPYGQFLMEIMTKNVTHHTSNEKEQVLIEYDMIINNEKRQFSVRIESMEVPS